ncbi:zinc-dependent alcohol dehydrogenase family protein [Sodalis sp. RH20]|uniref:zinc-dependent alcohol dehydrogenase family protein n=1 Tax=unclassified Sodalis (in: enterobacteria) TaxID=2636512 RepID=UPI0039B62F85
MMRLYRLRIVNKKRVLSLESGPIPKPGPKEILVLIKAVSLNYRDLMIQDGLIFATDGLIPLSDAAGIVCETGKAVKRWKAGDRVASLFFPDWLDGAYDRNYGANALGGNTQNGVLSEYVVFPENSVIGIGHELSFARAAALPCAALTAWQAMFVRTRIVPDERVLIQGTGGVALSALQFANAAGASVIILSSQDDKLEKAKNLGATHAINYINIPHWDKEIARVTNGKGVSFILENGGPGTFDRSLNALSTGGRIAQIGVLTGFGPSSNLMQLQNKNADILGITVGSAYHFMEMLKFISDYKISPVLDKVFSFENTQLAYEYLRSRAHFGKVIINVHS